MCGATDLTGVWAVENQLNAVIGDAVHDVKTTLQPTTRLHYVDPNLPSSPFVGKHLCNGGESDFNGLDLIHREYSFHPNASGQQDYAVVLKSAMS